jgi:cbb3-type cytochrome oxidase subunit 3
MIPIINGLLTLLLIIIFLAICAWAWNSRNTDSFEKMARLPLEENNSLVGDNNSLAEENISSLGGYNAK